MSTNTYITLSMFDEKGYLKMKPLVDSWITAREKVREQREKWRELPKESPDLLPEELDQIIAYEKEFRRMSKEYENGEYEYKVYTASEDLAIKTINLDEIEYEGTAYNDFDMILGEENNDVNLVSNIIYMNPLIPAEKLSTLYKKYFEAIDSINIDEFIETHCDSADWIALEIYHRAIRKIRETMEYAIKNQLSLLMLRQFA